MISGREVQLSMENVFVEEVAISWRWAERPVLCKREHWNRGT